MKEVNPDLFFNRATVFEYLERYNEATSDFQKAHVIDPNLGGESRSDQIIKFVSMAYNAIANKGRLKTNRLNDMVKSIPTSIPSIGENDKNMSKIVDISVLM